jgi:hypothetical protein
VGGVEGLSLDRTALFLLGGTWRWEKRDLVCRGGGRIGGCMVILIEGKASLQAGGWRSWEGEMAG